MGHSISYNVYDGEATKEDILFDINEWAYDPLESYGYHGGMTFHPNNVYDSYDEACDAIRNMERRSYEDHAVKFKDHDGNLKWCVKVEYHC